MEKVGDYTVSYDKYQLCTVQTVNVKTLKFDIGGGLVGCIFTESFVFLSTHNLYCITVTNFLCSGTSRKEWKEI